MKINYNFTPANGICLKKPFILNYKQLSYFIFKTMDMDFCTVIGQ